jgi:uncharacterized protein HemY
MGIGPLLIVVGLVIVLVGVAIQFGLPIGRLPGDISINSGNLRVYAPITTGILLSVILTVVLNLILRSR